MCQDVLNAAFCISDAILLTDIEARNQISHCLEGYSVSQVRVLFSYLLRFVFKNWIQSEGKAIVNIPQAMTKELSWAGEFDLNPALNWADSDFSLLAYIS